MKGKEQIMKKSRRRSDDSVTVANDGWTCMALATAFYCLDTIKSIRLKRYTGWVYSVWSQRIWESRKYYNKTINKILYTLMERESAAKKKKKLKGSAIKNNDCNWELNWYELQCGMKFLFFYDSSE